MRISVFTPTYNRGYCLERLFESLQSQTFRDFEWVVIDDGSTDDTSKVIDGLIPRATFPIKYKKFPNGGKHRAINRGVQYVDGELMFFLDSDDWLRNDALEWINKIEMTITDSEKSIFAGVQGLKCHTDGSLVGSTFNGEVLDTTTIQRTKNGIRGDKAEAYYTYLIKKYPFPEFDGEKFATERLVWNQIAAEGRKVRYFNEAIYYCEYLEDGLTFPGNKLYADNPKQWALAIYQDHIYGDTNRYYTSVQVYIYYLWTKKRLSLSHMAEYLHFPLWKILSSVIMQSFFDIMRYIVKRPTILSSQNISY